MDQCNQSGSLIRIEAQDKLSYISLISQPEVNADTSQPVLDQVEGTIDTTPSSSSESYFDDGRKPKLRKRNPENWKQNVRKRNKNKGLEYIKANGEICERKKLGPPCTCKEKCYLKIGMAACEKIFQNFWKLGDHALQNAYIAGCVRIFLPKHCYKKDGIPSRRFFSRNFHVTVNGVDTEVCKQAFLNIHAISNGRLDRLLKKKQEIGNTGFDERGRHSNKVNKIPFEKIKLVHKHIDSVRQKAGYTGKRKPKKVEILPGLLNIRTMYRSYKEEMMLKGLEPVCEYRYRKIFHTDFHLDFGKIVMPNEVGQKQQSLKPSQESNQVQPPTQHINNISQDKQTNHIYQKNCTEKKMEALTELTLQDMNLNVQVNTNLKGNRQLPVYAQVGTQNNKEFHIRAQEPASFVFSSEVLRLDYSNNFNGLQQQTWVFPNQS